jgi:arginine N-succinyltransferase
MTAMVPVAKAVPRSLPHSWLVRPIASRDLPALIALAEALGAGMTTLPADRDALAAKIDLSVESFAGRADRACAQFLLVLEDLGSGTLLGTAGLYPHVGSPYGFFSYKRLRLIQRSAALGVGCEVDMLALANDYTGATEVGTLSVRPEYKGSGAGRLLARSRYMLVAAFPDLFSPLLMAELRGWQDENGRSPFWDCVGARFFDMDFATADKVSAVRGNDFISELLPKHPVYVNLLPEAARDAIGRPHPSSAPAMAMLLGEGFRFEGYVDVFDAGPQLHCNRDQVATVRSSRRAALIAGEPGAGIQSLVAVGDLSRFGVVAAPVEQRDGDVALPSAAAATLAAQPGDILLHCPFHAA